MNLNEKICVLGAGPSGMSAAWYLQQKGYTNVTVLERLDRVGGKCNSPEYNGKYYEMGAGIGLSTYKNTIKLTQDIGIPPYKPVVTGKIIEPVKGEVMAGISEEEKPMLMEQMKKMATLLATEYKEITEPGHANCHPDLKMPFKDFCIKNGVPLCMKIWLNPYTSFGYGYFDMVPAAYVLQYLDFQTIQDFMNRDFISWTQGTESIWHKLATKLNHKVRLCTHIDKVVRIEDKVYVYTQFGKEEYDKIIFTSPLQDLPDYVNTDEEEDYLLSKIKYMHYKTFACFVENSPKACTYIPGNMVPSKSGHVMFIYDRWDDEDKLMTFYCYGDDNERVTSVECYQYLKEDLEAWGIQLKDVFMQKSWRYFPHVTGEQMKHGWYDKMEARQGKMNTYYAGEVMNFSDIEECVSYSKNLVERFF